MRRIFILLCITAVISAQQSTIHEQLIKDGHFGPGFSRDTPYEVVPIAHQKHPESPEHQILQLTSFKQEMRFYLEPTDGYLAGVNTPVFRAKKKLGEINDVQYKRIPNAISGKYNMYHDPINNGAFVIHHDKRGFPIINGIIDLKDTAEKLIILPLLDRFNKFFVRPKRDVNNNDIFMSNRTVQYPDLKFTHHHVVYKVPDTEVKKKKKKKQDDYEDDDDEDYSYENETDEECDVDEHELIHDEAHGHVDLIAFSRRKGRRYQANNNVPEIVYPQVLIIVESSYFQKFNRDVNKIIQYLLAFWNGIDLRYRVYQKPKIRLNIAGIILAEDSAMTPYITKNYLFIKALKDDIKIEVTEALRAKAAFMYPETEYNGKDKTLKMKRLNLTYDFAITMTTLDLCQPNKLCIGEPNEYRCDLSQLNNECNTLGYAYYTGGCAFDPDYKEVEGVGIVEDTGSFLGIVPTAHEIGHLLGASHNPDNEHGCDFNDGYLMSYQLRATEDSFIWSNCSAESVKKFLQREARAQCMFNKPDFRGKKLPRQLPGKLYTREQLCDRAVSRGTCSDPWYNKQCSRLYCLPADSDPRTACFGVPNHVVPEGATCGDGFHCINGRCEREDSAYVNLFLATTTTEDPNEDNVISVEE